MNATSSFFEAFYASPAQHPWLLWLAVGIGLALVRTQPGLDQGVRRYCVALAAFAAVDAWLTSNPIYGVGTLPGAAASLVPLGFVLIGDFRFLLLVTAATADGRLVFDRRSLGLAAALTLITPLGTRALMSFLPESPDSARVMFMVYEIAFVALTWVLHRKHPNVRSNPWVRSVSEFVMFYYALWATADIVILTTGSDLGFMLRVVPNLLYYGGLVAAIALFAPHPRTAAGHPR